MQDSFYEPERNTLDFLTWTDRETHARYLTCLLGYNHSWASIIIRIATFIVLRVLHAYFNASARLLNIPNIYVGVYCVRRRMIPGAHATRYATPATSSFPLGVSKCHGSTYSRAIHVVSIATACLPMLADQHLLGGNFWAPTASE